MGRTLRRPNRLRLKDPRRLGRSAAAPVIGMLSLPSWVVFASIAALVFG